MGCSPVDKLLRVIVIVLDAVYEMLCDLLCSKLFFLSFCIFSVVSFPYLPLWLRDVFVKASVLVIIGISALLVINFLRVALFAVFWSLTLGTHHFWWLPNFTADCCFSESFKPLISHETRNFPLFGKRGEFGNDKSDSKTIRSQQIQHCTEEQLDGKKERPNTTVVRRRA